MKFTTTLSLGAAAATLALTGCVTQATQPRIPATSSTTAITAPTLASTAGSLVGSVLQANSGAAGVMSSLGVPAAGTASNAAGVLTYCAKNNYLNPAKTGALTNQLLTSLGLPTAASATATAPTQDVGYLNGVAGMIISPTGELFSLDKIKGNAKDKACEFVLSKAHAFL